MKATLLALLILVVLIGSGFVMYRFYPYIFAKEVKGRILRVERVNRTEAIITSGRDVPAEQLFSFAVSIRDDKGEIHTASSEDRQWAVAQEGQCAEAKYLRYPFWDFASAGTFFGARLIRLSDCGEPGSAAP